jgi:hypothetical protein
VPKHSNTMPVHYFFPTTLEHFPSALLFVKLSNSRVLRYLALSVSLAMDCFERVGRRAFDCTAVPIQMLEHTSATSSMSNKGLFMLGNMGPFMLVEQNILVLQCLFSRKFAAHTRPFAWGRSHVNTLGTTANPYCYGARSWSLSRAPPPAIHGCHQCAAQPKSCIQLPTVLKQTLLHRCCQRARRVNVSGSAWLARQSSSQPYPA